MWGPSSTAYAGAHLPLSAAWSCAVTFSLSALSSMKVTTAWSAAWDSDRNVKSAAVSTISPTALSAAAAGTVGETSKPISNVSVI